MLRRAVSVAVAMAVLTVLGGCSKDEPSSLPTFTPGADTAPTEAASTPTTAGSSSQPVSGKPDTKGNEVFLGRITAPGADAKAAADAWIGYWKMRAAAYHVAKVDAAEISKFAVGKAVDDMVAYIGYLSQNKLHVEGDLRIGVESVALKGSTATVKSCFNDLSANTDASGKPVEKPARFLQWSGTLTQVEGEWRVSTAVITSRSPCDP